MAIKIHFSDFFHKCKFCSLIIPVTQKCLLKLLKNGGQTKGSTLEQRSVFKLSRA